MKISFGSNNLYKQYNPETNHPRKIKKISDKKTKNTKVLKVALGLAALTACTFLFLKKTGQILPNKFHKIEPQSKRSFLAFLKEPSLELYSVDPRSKQMFLGATGIKNKFRHSNSDYVDPETILARLKKANCVTSLTEKPFVTRHGKQITAGRKFNFALQFNKGKKYDMIFEVHDFIKDGKRTWVMRIYDNDKIKNSRSYLTRIGNFIENAYLGNFTHIPCGSYGEKFVLGNKICA